MILARMPTLTHILTLSLLSVQEALQQLQIATGGMPDLEFSVRSVVLKFKSNERRLLAALGRTP